MSALLQAVDRLCIADIRGRVQVRDWSALASTLDAQGCAMLEGLLTPEECVTVAGLYPQDDLFRSRVVMGRHGYGRGEYRYFSYPLPNLVAALRSALYPHLMPIANRWQTALGSEVRYPETHAEFIEQIGRAHV